MLRLASLVLLWAASMPAQAEQARFELQWRVDWNRHGANGADNEHLQSKAVLTLLDGERARIEDQGKRSRGLLTPAWGYREETERWRTVWQGTRRIADGKLLLALTVERRSCQVVATEADREATVRPCEGPKPKTFSLVCTTVEVEAGRDYITPKERRQSYPAWLCELGAGKQSPPAGSSPTPWLFGKQVCIESTQSPAGINHRLCQRKLRG